MKVNSLFHFFLKKVGIFFLILSVVTPLSFVQPPTPVLADKAGVCALPGKDGPTTTLSGVVNSYYPGTANVAAGATSVPVGARTGSATDIAAGDLLLVVQMQGADLDGNNDQRYGDGVGTAGTTGNTVVYSAANAYAGGNLGTNFSAGFYEYVVATGAVAGGFIPISSGLVNNYYSAAYATQGRRTFQVIRVPQYSSATLNGTVTALRWDGSTGGIVAFDVAGALNWNGNTVDVSTLGFRGGGGRQLGGGTGANTDYRTLSTNNANGSKGEGYAGTPRYLNNNGALLDNGAANEGFLNGSYGRGASGNGGGGSTDGRPSNNDENSGGGGGGNGGFGGMGGNAWNSGVVSGGFGGAPFLGSAPRLILGGGGGAGTTNNGTGTPGAGFASSGAAGGGVVMIRSGTITGTGTINANGATANQTVLNDGGGGGGAGGSVVVIARNGAGSVGTLTVTAVGGNGGVAWPAQTALIDRHGPGGGGGGGFVYTSGAVTGTSSVAGGLNGTTINPGQAFGATPGGAGVLVTTVTPATIPNSISGANCVPVTPVVSKTTSTPVLTQTPSGTTGTYTITVSPPVSGGGASGVNISDTLPTGFTYASTTSITFTGGSVRTSTTNPSVGTSTPSWGVFDILSGGSVQITFTVNISSTVALGTYQNPASASYLDPVRAAGDPLLSVNYDPASSTGEDIELVPMVPPQISKAFSLNPITVPGTSTLTFTLTNTNTVALTGAAFTDTFPAGMTRSSVPSSPQCSGTVTSTANSVTLAGGTIPASGTCTVTVIVSITTAGTYVNTSGAVSSTNGGTGNTAIANLVGNSAGTTPACTNGLPLVRWNFDTDSSGNAIPTGTNTTPAYSFLANNVLTASSGAGVGMNNIQIAANGNSAPNNWEANGFAGTLQANDYFEFLFNATNYTGVGITFAARRVDTTSRGPQIIDVQYSRNNAAFVSIGTVNITNGYTTFTPTGIGTNLDNDANARIRLYPYNATSVNRYLRIDDVSVTGCATPAAPTIIKAFTTSPIALNTNSTLTFTITNPNNFSALSGVAFADTYPSGVVNATPLTTTNSCGGTLTAAAGGSSISLSGGNLATSATCTITVAVTGTSAGVKNNISGQVASTESGANTGASGTASATLTVVAPPSISKAFSPNPIAVGGTSTLTFTVTNPIANTVALTGVAFTDAFPAGLQVAGTPSATTTNCGAPTFAPAAGATTLNFSAGTIAVGGTCTVSVNVTTTTSGAKNNVSGSVSSTNGGTGNTASSTLTENKLTLVKNVTESYFAGDGNILHYSYVVTNDGSSSLAGPVTVADDKSTNETCPALTTVGNGDSSLDPGESITCTATYTVVTADTSAGFVTNIASAVVGGVTSNADTKTVNRQLANFGHLPSAATGPIAAYPSSLNLYANGGASNVTGSTFLGASAPIETDSTNAAVFAVEATDNGVTPTGTWKYGTVGAGNGGSVTTAITCPSNPCYISAWIDFNGDGDFNDASETIIANQTVNGGTTPTFTFDIPGGTAGNTVTAGYFARFRLYASDPGTASPSGGSIIVGEIEDYQFSVAGGVAKSTPITVAYFRAQKQGNTVIFNWSTGTETGNVGFNLYVESSKGQLQLINDKLIPSKVIDSLDRQDYTFSAKVKGNKFYIEDVSVLGETRQHGPFKIGEAYGNQLDADKIDQDTIQAEHDKKEDEQQVELVQDIKDSDTVLKSVLVPTATPKPTKTLRPTATPRPTKTLTPTATPKPTKTLRFTATPKPTKTLRITVTMTPTITVTPTATATFTPTPTDTGTFEPTATGTPEPTATGTLESTVTGTLESTATGTFEPTATYTTELTATPTATYETEPTATFTPTATYTVEPSATPTATHTIEPTATHTLTATFTTEPTATATLEPLSGTIDPKNLLLTNTLNIKVSQTGLYRVTYEALQTAGLDLLGVSARNITLINRDQIIPIYMVSQSGGFGPGDYFEFYGKALDTMYTNTNIYTVQVSSQPVVSIASDSTVPDSGLAAPASYSEILTVNNQLKFSNGAPSDDPWYASYLLTYTTPKSYNYDFQINALADPNASVALELTVWGGTKWPQSPDHHLRVNINGIALADKTFDDNIEQIIKVSLPAGTLREGVNTLQLTLVGDTGVPYDLAYLDKYSISYQRAFQASSSGNLTFTAAADVFNVSNLPSANVTVYRMNDAGLIRMENVNVSANGATFTAAFAGSSQPSTYFVFVAALSPTLEATRLKADLNNSAQYLIISHPNFIDGLQPLVQARRAQGYTVSVVDVNDLYAQYNYGIFDPSAIKKYIAYAATNLGTQYVLLVGGDTYDYRNFTGSNSISFIPSIYVTTGNIAKFVPVDPAYADLNFDNVPDLAIGRFPVRTAAELDMMVAKTLAYANKNYGRTAVFASDVNDGALSFKDISNGIASGLPSSWTTSNIHLNDIAIAAARTQLIASMNNGSALVTYTGHSSPNAWTFSGLFNMTDAAALTNTGRPFALVQWGCWNTYYVDPVNNYLVQKFLFSGNQGAAAVFGAVTLTDSESERLLGVELMPRLTMPGMTMGQALLDAKIELAKTHPELLDVLLGWSFMGDPALIVEP